MDGKGVLKSISVVQTRWATYLAAKGTIPAGGGWGIKDRLNIKKSY